MDGWTGDMDEQYYIGQIIKAIREVAEELGIKNDETWTPSPPHGYEVPDTAHILAGAVVLRLMQNTRER